VYRARDRGVGLHPHPVRGLGHPEPSFTGIAETLDHGLLEFLLKLGPS
jgi:hypothetical protein